MTTVYIRRADPGETPLSPAEQWVAVREGFQAISRPVAGPRFSIGSRYARGADGRWALRRPGIARAPAFAEGRAA